MGAQLGELTCERLLGLKMRTHDHAVGDGGTDGLWHGHTVQIKTTPYANGHYIIKPGKTFSTELGILVRLRGEVLGEIVGWCTAISFAAAALPAKPPLVGRWLGPECLFPPELLHYVPEGYGRRG